MVLQKDRHVGGGQCRVAGDLSREGEREIVADWLAACPEFSAEQVRLDGGGAILRRASEVANV
jgi:hypothetical protein